MKTPFYKLLLVTAVILPAHAFAATSADTGNKPERAIQYMPPNSEYRTTTYRTPPFYDREGYVANNNTTVIQAMQQALREAGFYKLGDVNGIWNQHTADALYSYQKANGLRGTARLDYETGQRLGMVMPAMDKMMEGSTRAPMANATTRQARGLAGRRVIQDPAIIVSDEYDSHGNLISRDVNGRRQAMGAGQNRPSVPRNYVRLDKMKIQSIQQTLADAGFYKAGVDGLWGRETAKALRNYQASNGLKATGMLNPATLDKLGMVESESNIAPAAGR